MTSEQITQEKNIVSFKRHKQRAVVTIATGLPIYIQMAANLARSFKVWHKDSPIIFALVTDQKHLLPSDLSDIQIIEIEPEQYGRGFSTKLHLDKFAPAEQTLFVDADCLCTGPLDAVFDRFDGHDVSVIGKNIREGDFFGDIRTVRSQFGLEHLPCFVGGIYYFEKGPVSDKVFATARQLEPRYDELGLIRLRGRPNEEPLMSIAMALHKQIPVEDDGSIKAEPMFYPSRVEVDVLRGKSGLWNLPEDPKFVDNWHWHLKEAHPCIVHFHCHYVEHDPYTREVIKLKKVMVNGWPLLIADAYALAVCSAPQWIVRSAKNALRPIYRAFFGTRPVKKSNRIVD